jgi:glycosyltransferase involved in cell wall biosynthesis
MDKKLLLTTSSFPPYLTPSAVLVKNIFDEYGQPFYAFASSAFSKIDNSFIPPCDAKYLKFPTGRIAEYISRHYHHFFLTIYVSKLEKIVKSYRPDIIFANYPRDVMLVASFIVSKKYNIPIFIYMHDLWEENVYKNQSKSAHVFAKKWESVIFNNSERIICCTEMMKEHYNNKYKISADIIYHSIPDQEIDIKNFEKNELKKEKFTIAYAGSISRLMNLDNFQTIKKALELLPENFCLKIYPISYLKLEELGLDSKKISQEIVSRDELKQKLNQADLVFAPLAFNSTSIDEVMTVFSNKLLSYLVSGTPILSFGPKGCYHNQSASNGGWGIVLDENNEKKLAETILDFYKGKYDNSSLLKNAKIEAGERRASLAAKKIKNWVNNID